ncbi:spike base protein, RCAP_Rcc01079 family [Sphingomonas hankookensis]|uniref:spike base protein, RCAP_Rcc01079 family n=1 Tax=Sphingomonas hankookensis TaxID=563996 RepID=UPI003B682564
MAYSPAYFPNTPATPVRRSVVVTPSDTARIDPTKSLIIVSGGTVVIQCSEDTAPQIFPNLPPYAELTFEVVKVLASGTTAQDIRGCY